MHNEFVMDVANVDSLTTYVEITDFLTAMSSVQEMMLLQANGNNHRFKLRLLGSKQAFFIFTKA